MKTVEILSVGEEVLSGSVDDTNASFLSEQCGAIGIRVLFRQTCGDNKERIQSSLRLALSRSDLVLVTGGLGPTEDDITRSCAADVFGLQLIHSKEAEQDIRAFFERRGIPMSANNLLQAQVPEGARVLKNHWGTAPGLWLESEIGSAVLLPGVPREMKELFFAYVLPVLREQSGVFREFEVLRFVGISESLLDEKISVLPKDPSVSVAPYAKNGEIELQVSAEDAVEEEAKRKCKKKTNEILSLVGEYCYGFGDTNLERELVSLFTKKGITLATAESCTGGLLSQRITSVSGASKVFSLGVCTYSEKEKQTLLKVKKETLEQFGVYSKECALEMARGIRNLAQSEVGVGITGIAGPTGGTESDPVGTVYLAVVSSKEECCERVVLGTPRTSREQIRVLASNKALEMVLNSCQNI